MATVPTSEAAAKPKRAPRGSKSYAFAIYVAIGDDDSAGTFQWAGETTARTAKLALAAFLEGGGKVSPQNSYLVLDKAKQKPLTTSTKIEVS